MHIQISCIGHASAIMKASINSNSNIREISMYLHCIHRKLEVFASAVNIKQ